MVVRGGGVPSGTSSPARREKSFRSHSFIWFTTTYEGERREEEEEEEEKDTPSYANMIVKCSLFLPSMTWEQF